MLLINSRLSLSLPDGSILVLFEITSIDMVRGLPPAAWLWLWELLTAGTFLGAAKEGGLGRCASLFCIMYVDVGRVQVYS